MMKEKLEFSFDLLWTFTVNRHNMENRSLHETGQWNYKSEQDWYISLRPTPQHDKPILKILQTGHCIFECVHKISSFPGFSFFTAMTTSKRLEIDRRSPKELPSCPSFILTTKSTFRWPTVMSWFTSERLVRFFGNADYMMHSTCRRTSICQ